MKHARTHERWSRQVRWAVAAALLPALGCSVDEPRAPVPQASSLILRIEGDPEHLQGPVTIVAEPTDPDAVRRVELRLGDQLLGEASRAPFTFDLDSSVFPDGPAVLDAAAEPVEKADELRASIDVVFANAAPEITIVEPQAGVTLIGSPSKGFSVKPVVKATDGNGIVAIWAEAGAGPVDLGKGDGTVEVPLAAVGVDFPHPPVAITLHARDASGAESAAVVEVVPSNVKVRFERQTGFQMTALSRIDVLDDGRPLLQLGASIHLLSEPSLAAKPSVSFNKVDSFVRLDHDLFFFAAKFGGADLVHANVDGTSEVLFGASAAADQQIGFGPFVHSSGRVIASWQDTGTVESHVRAFEQDGTPAFEAVLPTLTPLRELGELPDGRLVTVGKTAAVDGFLQLFDGSTGAPSPAFPQGAGELALLDDEGIVTVYYTSAVYGFPETRIAGFDLDGTPVWDIPLESASPELTRRLPDGGVLTFVYGGLVGAPSSLQVMRAGGAELLWSGGLDKQDRLLGTLPGTNEMIIGRFNTTTSVASVFQLHPDGTIGWLYALPGGSGYRVQILSDGSLAFTSTPLSPTDPTSVVFQVIGPDGEPRWSADLDAANVLGVAEHGDLLLLPENRGDMQPFAYEAYDRATGKLVWRYREGVSPPLFSQQTTRASDPWGVLLAPLTLAAKDAQGNPSYTSVVLGFVP